MSDDSLGMAFAQGRYTPPADTAREVDLCLIATTEVEEDALVGSMFSDEDSDSRPYPPSYRRFYRTRYHYRRRAFSVVGCRSSDQGSMNALAALSDVFSHFRPKIVVMVGIAGALDDELALGDVLVADSAYWYERGKDSGEGVARELRAFKLPEQIQNLVDSILGDMRRSKNFPNASARPFGTGEKVVAADLSDIKSYLFTVNRKIAAVEMESGGFFQYFESPSFRSGSIAWLVVKGISDHADPDKGNSPQDLAARSSIKVALPLACEILMQLDRAATSNDA